MVNVCDLSCKFYVFNGYWCLGVDRRLSISGLIWNYFLFKSFSNNFNN